VCHAICVRDPQRVRVDDVNCADTRAAMRRHAQSSGAVSSRVVLRFVDPVRVTGARGGFVPSAKSPSNVGNGSRMRVVEIRELESRVTPGIVSIVELSQK
jgi:hypothetical protein